MTARYLIRLFSLTLLIVVGATIAQAQDANTVLTAAIKAVGADKVGTLHYVGSGSSYAVTPDPVPAGGWPHRVMKSYVHDLNFKSITSRLQYITTDGTGNQTVNRTADANSAWDTQYEFWITPYGFLKGAMAHHATVESKTVWGTPYRVLTVNLPGNHKVSGYINDKDLVERVETSVGDRVVEASYRDYRDFNGLMVPMMVTQKHAGHLSLILIGKDVKIEP